MIAATVGAYAGRYGRKAQVGSKGRQLVRHRRLARASDAPQLSLEIVVIQVQRLGILAHETASKEATGQAVEVVRLDGLEHGRIDLRQLGQLVDIQPALEAFPPEPITDRKHRDNKPTSS